MDNKKLQVAVAIPCHNEELTIAKVVADFKRELPEAKIIVADNGSTDKTYACAQDAGAEVIFEKRLGKGNAVKKLFEFAEQDILIMVDGDDTYFANDVHKLIGAMENGTVDMVVGNRVSDSKNMSASHGFGNWLFRGILNLFFRSSFKDILSGYRAISRNFYKNIPVLANGFEVETELTLQALEKGYCVKEVSVNYKARSEGSHSKIKEFSDGSKIILTIISLFRDYKPLTFFSFLAVFLIVPGMILGLRVVFEYIETGLVPRLPTAVLSITFIILGFISLLSGLTVGAINRRYLELENIIKKNKLKK